MLTPQDPLLPVEQRHPVGRVVEEPLHPGVGRVDQLGLLVEALDEALHHRGDDQGHRRPDHGAPPVADRVVGITQGDDRHCERGDGEPSGHPQLFARAGERQPQDGHQEQRSHARRATARRVAHQGGEREQQVGGHRVEPGPLRTPLGQQEDHGRQGEGEGSECQDDPGDVVRREQDGDEAQDRHPDKRDGDPGRASMVGPEPGHDPPLVREQDAVGLLA